MDDDFAFAAGGENRRPTRRIIGARIVSVQRIKNPMFAALANRAHPDHYRAYDPNGRNAITHAEALRRFQNRNASRGDQHQDEPNVTEEPVDIDALMAASGVDPTLAKLEYDDTHETQIQAWSRALRIRAECLVEYDSTRQTLPFGDDEADAIGVEPVHKRARADGSPIVQATVFGDWPSLSRALEFDIDGVPTYNNASHLDALRADCSILPSLSDGRVALRDLRLALIEGSEMHSNAADAVLRSIVALAPRTLRDNTVERAELRALFEKSRCVSFYTLLPFKRVFATTLLVLFADMIGDLALFYGRRGWQDIVARGELLVRRVCSMLRAEPHVLAFQKLKYQYCADAQSDIKTNPDLTPAIRASRCAALRWLVVMPELTLTAYVKAVRTLSLDEAVDETAIHSVDVYHSLLRHDLLASPACYVDEAHARRQRVSEHGSTSGHMFTVITDDHKVDGEQYDCGCAEGALALTIEMPPLNAPSAPASTADDAPGGSSYDAYLDMIRRGVQSARLGVGAPRRAEPEWSDARSRCSIGMSREQFEAALGWLCEKSIVVRERHVGVGPQNAERPFDAFYIASIHTIQERALGSVTDIYRRGLETLAEHGDAVLYASAPGLIADFYDLLRFEKQARHHMRNVVTQYAQSRVSPDAERDDIVADNSGAALTVVERMAALAEESAAYFAAPPSVPSTPSAYDTLMPSPPEPGGRPCGYRLLRLFDGRTPTPGLNPMIDSLCPEQRRCMQQAWRLPLTIVTGRGGTGKTHVLCCITSAYPPEQVLLTAFTGKVCSELSRRVLPTSTIHSLLYRHVLYLQERRRLLAAIRTLQVRVRDKQSREARIAHLRAGLYQRLGTLEQQSPFAHKRVLIIDEGSLVAFDLFVRLLDAMHEYQAERTSGFFLEKVIISGDIDQNEAIGYGSVLRDLARALPHCVQRLTVNHRSSGRGIFDMAQRVSQRDSSVLPADWSSGENEARVAAFARSRDADSSVVFFEATEATLRRQIAWVLELLGAVAEDREAEPTPAQLELRRQIHMIATTNFLVRQINGIVRTLYFAARVGRDELTAASPPGIMAGEKIYIKSNKRIAFRVRATGVPGDGEQEDEYVGELECPGESALARAARRVPPSETLQRLDRRMVQLGLGVDRSMRTVVVTFSNSKIIELVQAYDSPWRVTGETTCRCGLCPPAVAGGVRVRYPCVLEPYAVPALRRGPPQSGAPLFHNAGRTAGTRRMAVFRSADGLYSELDVEAHLDERSSYEFGYATTTYKFQGSESEVTFLVCTSDSRYSTCKVAYTAMTRARRLLVVVGQRSVLKRIIDRPAAMRRSNFPFRLAQSAAAVHASLARDDRPHYYLADLMGDDGALPIVRTLLSTQRAVAERDRATVWRYYDEHREQTCARNEPAH